MMETIYPVGGRKAWQSKDLAISNRQIVLPQVVLNDIDPLLREAEAQQKTQDNFAFDAIDLPRLRQTLRPIVEELKDGCGFALLRGFPTHAFSTEALKLALLIIGNHMGLVGPQAPRAKGIGEVMDVNPPEGDRYYYHVGGALPMHMDPVDVVGLLCVRKAKQGGESRIVSAMAVHDEILRTRPDLLKILYRGFRHRRREHRRHDGKALTDHYCPVFADIGGEIICNYLPAPIRMAVDDGLMTLTAQEEEALQLLDETSERDDLCLQMDMEPGDIQFLNNRIIQHGRADYEDFDALEKRRLMLRLWLTIPGWKKYPDHIPHTDVETQSEPA